MPCGGVCSGDNGKLVHSRKTDAMERVPIKSDNGTDPGGNPALDLPTGDPRPGLYRHYKGGRYEVLGLVRHSESLEVMVLYRALYGAQGLWVRPRPMFLETVLIGDVTQARFAWLSELPVTTAKPPASGEFNA
jgi:hypothetical protein